MVFIFSVTRNIVHQIVLTASLLVKKKKSSLCSAHVNTKSEKKKGKKKQASPIMAGRPGTNPTTYSPSLKTQKTRSTIFKDDWVRPDGRGFQQCRPACTFVYFFCGFSSLFSYTNFILRFSLIIMGLEVWVVLVVGSFNMMNVHIFIYQIFKLNLVDLLGL